MMIIFMEPIQQLINQTRIYFMRKIMIRLMQLFCGEEIDFCGKNLNIRFHWFEAYFLQNNRIEEILLVI